MGSARLRSSIHCHFVFKAANFDLSMHVAAISEATRSSHVPNVELEENLSCGASAILQYYEVMADNPLFPVIETGRR